MSSLPWPSMTWVHLIMMRQQWQIWFCPLWLWLWLAGQTTDGNSIYTGNSSLDNSHVCQNYLFLPILTKNLNLLQPLEIWDTTKKRRKRNESADDGLEAGALSPSHLFFAQKLMSLDVGRALCRLHEEGEVGLETKGLVSHSMGASLLLLLLSLPWSFFSES